MISISRVESRSIHQYQAHRPRAYLEGQDSDRSLLGLCSVLDCSVLDPFIRLAM